MNRFGGACCPTDSFPLLLDLQDDDIVVTSLDCSYGIRSYRVVWSIYIFSLIQISIIKLK